MSTSLRVGPPSPRPVSCFVSTLFFAVGSPFNMAVAARDHRSAGRYGAPRPGRAGTTAPVRADCHCNLEKRFGESRRGRTGRSAGKGRGGDPRRVRAGPPDGVFRAASAGGALRPGPRPGEPPAER